MSNDYDSNKPMEAVSDAPEFLDELDDDALTQEEWEVTNPECPECGSKRMTKMARATSPDDYTFQYECINCGATWED